MIELLDEGDAAFTEEFETLVTGLVDRLEQFEFRTMLRDPDDFRGAIVTVHPGAGGTESQDWAMMLLRMYTKWMEQNDYKYQVVDIQEGEEGGITRATVEVEGDYAFGYLKAEKGVHRLVRISPFDANSRRHTSFASVFVYPDIADEITVEIQDKDLKVDTYRASGAGGQHVNKTDSAVRITHLPTGIVVQSQAERSQHRNRETAMRLLKARLYQFLKAEREKSREELEAEKKEIAFGSQIRSYVLHPYTLVKDHRTGWETSDVEVGPGGGATVLHGGVPAPNRRFGRALKMADMLRCASSPFLRRGNHHASERLPRAPCISAILNALSHLRCRRRPRR